jgi:hypothetical protein
MIAKGLEPLTNGLKGHCSTIELCARIENRTCGGYISKYTYMWWNLERITMRTTTVNQWLNTKQAQENHMLTQNGYSGNNSVSPGW